VCLLNGYQQGKGTIIGCGELSNAKGFEKAVVEILKVWRFAERDGAWLSDE
jgi:hypothetical protein